MMNNTKINNRKPEFDMIKGVVIIFVVFTHLFEATGFFGTVIANENYLFSINLLLMLICILCSGYLYTARGGILSEILKKIKGLILPCLGFSAFFLITYFLRYVVIEGKPPIWFFDNALTNILGFLNWNPRLNEIGYNQMQYAFVPYWFVYQLFVGMCLFILIYSLIKDKKIYVRIASAVILLAAATLCNYFDVQHTLKMAFSANVSYYCVLINIFGFAALLMIGSIFKELRVFDFDNQKKASTLAALVASLLVLAVYWGTYLKNLENGAYVLQFGKWGPLGWISMPLSACAGISLMFVMMLIFHHLKNAAPLKKLLCFLGRNTFDILMIHFGVAEIIIWLSGNWYKIYHESPGEHFSIAGCIITIAVTLAITIAFIIVKGKINFLQKK